MSRGPPNPNSPPTPALDFEAQVRANILAQPLCATAELGTVADLDLPHDFLTRLADRALRASFYERFRAVVADDGEAVPSSTSGVDAHTPQPLVATTSVGTEVRIEQTPLDPDQVARWSSLTETPPALASFRSPITTDPTPSVTDHGHLHASQRIARKHLARDGLLPALARVIAALGPVNVLASDDPVALLSSAGIPTDLLNFLRPDFAPTASTPEQLIRSIAGCLAVGEPIDRTLISLRRPRFQPRPSLPGFRPTSDSGRDTIQLLRAHATRATHYAAPGDGGNLDLLTGTVAALPTTPFHITTHTRNAQPLHDALAHVPRSAPTTIHTQSLPVSQWAGDNAKPGTLNTLPAHLAPRFASRNEYHPTFIPGDDLAASAPDIPSARSPLLFQGGNLLIVDDLPRSRRVLLVGEAEIHRNRALGLSAEQTLAFLRTEFAADACEVLPAASYHIDQELTIRSTPQRTLAFVPHVLAAATVIIEASLVALADSNRWPLALVQEALAHLRASRPHDALNLIWRALDPERTPELAFPLSFAEVLSIGPADSGVGNLHRFLLALDHLAAALLPPSFFPDPNLAALHRSLHRLAADRAKIRTILSRLGWAVIAVSALPEESRGINPLNGLHTLEKYLMTSYGGLFTPLDDIAATAFRAALGASVTVVPVSTAESQRRQGALHCSLSLYGQ